MKAERRHELQHNALADRLGDAISGAKNYSQAIIATIVGAVVLLGAYLYLSNRSQSTEAAAWTQYLSATDTALRRGTIEKLIQLTNQYPTTKGGLCGRLALADLQYQTGVQQLFENRSQAVLNLNGARENYDRLLLDASDEQLKARATLGLARCYEAENQLPRARTEYESFITKYPNDVFIGEAKARLADLNRKSTEDFYGWLAQQDVKPPAADLDTTPTGTRPNFDLRNLPREGPVFSDPAEGTPGEMPIGPAATNSGPTGPTGTSLAPPGTMPVVPLTPSTPAADEKSDSATSAPVTTEPAAPAASTGTAAPEKGAADTTPADGKAPVNPEPTVKDAPPAEPK